MKRWRLDPSRVERRLLGLAGDADFSRLCLEVYAVAAEANGRKGVSLLGDKNPSYSLFAETLARIFPRSRFVHIVRDYRDNVLSFQHVRFDLTSVPALAYRWLYYNRSIARAARRFPERFFSLRFEDLVAQPYDCLRGVCRFLGVPFSPRMLERPRARRAEASLHWHPHLGSDLDPGQAGKWRAMMRLEDVRQADGICQPFAADFGYEPANQASRFAPKRALFGVAWGHVVSAAERFIFRLPLWLRTRIIHGYRIATGNKIS